MKRAIFITVTSTIQDQECLNRKTLDYNRLKEYIKGFISVLTFTYVSAILFNLACKFLERG